MYYVNLINPCLSFIGAEKITFPPQRYGLTDGRSYSQSESQSSFASKNLIHQQDKLKEQSIQKQNSKVQCIKSIFFFYFLIFSIFLIHQQIYICRILCLLYSDEATYTRIVRRQLLNIYAIQNNCDVFARNLYFRKSTKNKESKLCLYFFYHDNY